MSDLIPDALDNQPEESVATGVVDDNQVAVQKKPKQDNNDIVWDVKNQTLMFY